MNCYTQIPGSLGILLESVCYHLTMKHPGGASDWSRYQKAVNNTNCFFFSWQNVIFLSMLLKLLYYILAPPSNSCTTSISKPKSSVLDGDDFVCIKCFVVHWPEGNRHDLWRTCCRLWTLNSYVWLTRKLQYTNINLKMDRKLQYIVLVSFQADLVTI